MLNRVVHYVGYQTIENSRQVRAWEYSAEEFMALLDATRQPRTRVELSIIKDKLFCAAVLDIDHPRIEKVFKESTVEELVLVGKDYRLIVNLPVLISDLLEKIQGLNMGEIMLKIKDA